MHIGGAPDPLADIDGPVALLGGRPVVHGSSLKGAFRAQLEHILIESYSGAAETKPCIPADWKNLSQDERGLINDLKKYKGSNCGYGYKRPGGSKGSQKLSICPTCYLLGTMGLMGFMQVPYLYSDIDPEDSYAIRQDRALLSGAGGSNRRLQLIPDGARFSGTLRVLLSDDLRGWRLGEARPLKSREYEDTWLVRHPWKPEDVLSKLVEPALRSIKQMGGFRSKGCGDVEVTCTRVVAA